MRSKIILIAALLMGIVTTVLFFNFMKNIKATPVFKDDKVVNVVAVKQEIPENTRISAGMLEIKQIPESGALSQAIKNPQEAEGKIAASDLTAGEVLLPNHLKTQEEETLFISKKVREGYRAISVGVNIVQSVSNLIEPGDYVDIVVNTTDKSTATVKSSVLLEKVHVLAIGRRMVEAKPDTPYAEYSQVTLELTPSDGVKVINADEDASNTLSLMLNSRILKEPSQTIKK
jgi:pilus assembly protein CpaB